MVDTNNLPSEQSYGNDGPPHAPLHLPQLDQLIKIFTKRRATIIPALLNDSGHLVENDKDKSVILNQFFIQPAAQSAADGIPPPIALPRVTSEDEVLHEFRVSCEEVRAALRSLDTRKAPGFDGLPTRLLIMVADDITP